MNNRIRAREVRLISETGEQVGIISIEEAQQAAAERDLDLVEVAPNATPPVCRLMDYGKFRYEQSKKDREARKHQKQVELKELRLKPKTDEHDINVKARKARRFLQSGDKVKFTLRFRGREMAHTDIGREILNQVIEQLRDIALVEQKPLLESRALSLIMAPNAKTLKAVRQAQQAQSRKRKSEKDARHKPQEGAETEPETAEDEEEAFDEDDELDDEEVDGEFDEDDDHDDDEDDDHDDDEDDDHDDDEDDDHDDDEDDDHDDDDQDTDRDDIEKRANRQQKRR